MLWLQNPALWKSQPTVKIILEKGPNASRKLTFACELLFNNWLSYCRFDKKKSCCWNRATCALFTTCLIIYGKIFLINVVLSKWCLAEPIDWGGRVRKQLYRATGNQGNCTVWQLKKPKIIGMAELLPENVAVLSCCARMYSIWQFQFYWYRCYGNIIWASAWRAESREFAFKLFN